MDQNLRDAAQTVWDYMRLREPVRPADCLVVLGSRDDRVASYAARLAMDHRFETIVVTGGDAHHNDMLATSWEEGTEAEHFAAVMRATGLTQSILCETQANNTGQNATYSYELLRMNGIRPTSLLIVTKPYMERRARATFEAQWPDASVALSVTSPDFSLRTYPNDAQPLHDVITIMVGDLQRIMEYPRRGFQTSQYVPDDVKHAYTQLIDAGFTNHTAR